MRGFHRATPVVTLAAALSSATCAFPTDKSNAVFVTVDVPKQVVLRGQKLPASAHLWQRTGGDSSEIKNVVFKWTSGNEDIATVKDDGLGGAEVTGVVSGTVTVTAEAPAFEKAQAANVTLRVANPLEVDSVRPKFVHHGGLVTVYGVGVDSIFVASLSGVNLIEYPFSRVRDPSGSGRITYWVPPPARPDSLFYLGAGVFGFDTAMTGVLKDDVFEPNDSVPANINLDLPGPWPGTILAPIIFTNPALEFEPQVRDRNEGGDWFRFGTVDTTRALTFFIQYPSFGDTASTTTTFLIDSLNYLEGTPGDLREKFEGGPAPDFVGSDFSLCKGNEFQPLQVQRESTTIALRTLPSHALHVITFFTRTQRYGLTVANGYFTSDPTVKMDRYEENDMCHYADSIPGRPNPLSRIHLPARATGLQFSDTMTIDNPFETDWYRLEVPAPALGDSVVIRVQSRPSVAARDSSDTDVYVLTVPTSTTGLTEIASGRTSGSTENLVVDLPAGSYYVAVVDFAGVATRYSMCVRQVSLIKSCGLILPGPPVAGAPKLRPSSPTPALSPAAGASGRRSIFSRRHRQ